MAHAKSKPVLEQGNEPEDFELNGDKIWLGIADVNKTRRADFDVRIRRYDEGVCIDVYTRNSDSAEPVESLWLAFGEHASSEYD